MALGSGWRSLDESRSGGRGVPPETGRPLRKPVLPQAIVAGILSVVLAAAWFVYGEARAAARKSWLAELSGVADVKAGEITTWRAEMVGAGRTAARSPSFAQALADWIARGAPEDSAAARLGANLEGVRVSKGLVQFWILDPAGNVLLRSDKAPAECAAAGEAASGVRRERDSFLTDLHQDGEPPTPDLDLVAPVYRQATGGLVAILVFGIDPSDRLYPILGPWPGEHATPEAIIVREGENEIVPISWLRFRREPPLGLHLPKGRDPLAARAFGRPGAGDGVDYRGSPVLAAWRAIPGTGGPGQVGRWGLVAKVDASEAFAPMKRRARLWGGVAAVVLGLAALAGFLWWRQQRLVVELREKTAESEKRALLAHFGSLWQRATDVLLLLDEEMTIVEVNERVGDVYGYSRDEVVGKPVKFLHPDVRSSELQQRRELIDASGSGRYSALHVRKDGSTFPVEIASSVLEIDGRRFYQEVIRDVSERQEAEEALKKSESRFRQLFESVQEGFALHEIVVDEAGTPVDYVFLEVNPAFERLTGLKAAEITGRRVTEAIPGIESKWIETYGRVALGGGPVRFTDFAAPLAKTFRIDAFSPEPGKFAAIVADVTEERRQERLLRESEERFKATFDRAAVGIVHLSPDGRFLRVNPRFCEMLGYAERDLLRKTFRDVTHPDDQEAAEAARSSLLAGEANSYRSERRYVRADGSVLPAAVGVTAVRDEEGQARWFISVVEDLSASRIVEERLKGMLALTEKAGSLSEAEIVAEGIELAVLLTGSRVGYCHLVEEDGKAVRLLAFSKGALAACTAPSEGHYPLDRAGIWAECARTGRPAVHNDYGAVPDRGGLPGGHVSLSRHLSVPALELGRVRMILGVGNKETDYDEVDVRQAAVIVSDVWRLATARRLEEARREATARFRHLVEAQKALLLEWKLDPVVFTFVGSQLQDLLGYDPAGWLEDAGRWAEAVHPDDRERVVRERADVTAEGRDHLFDYRMVAADGRVVFVHEAIRILTDDAGVPARALGVLVDVTETHRNEDLVRALAAQGDRQLRTLESILEATPELIHLFDAEGRVQFTSASALKLLGRSAETYHGRTLTEVEGNSPVTSQAEERIREVVRTGRELKAAATLPTPSGARRISFTLTPVLGADGRVEAVISTGIDVTEERAALRRIGRLNSLLSAVSGTNRAVAVSRTVEELLGEVCRVAVESGNFAVSWVAWADRERAIAPFAARAGRASAFAAEVPISLDPSSPESRGPSAIAILEARTAVINDFLGPSGPARWRDVALRAGVASGAAVPLRRGGEVVAALGLFSADKDYFDAETTALLEEVGRAISFGLESLAHEEKRRLAEDELRETARRLTEAEAVGGTGSWYYEAAARTMTLSAGSARILGLPGNVPLPMGRMTEVVAPEDRERAAAAVLGVLKTGEPVEFEHRTVPVDGAPRTVVVRAEARRGADGELAGVFGTHADVSVEREREEERLLWVKVLESSSEAVLVTDPSGKILLVNRAFEEITGYSASEVVGKNPRILKSGRHDQQFYAAMWSVLLSSGRWRGEVWNRRKDGEVYPAILSLSVVRDGGVVTHFVGISSDVSEQKSAAERVQFLSHHDALTGLPNRPLFDALLDQAMAAARRSKRRMAVLCLDLDLFKTFNESFGHVEGDRLLKDLAGRLSGCLRGGDTLCRPGGDEFLVLVPSVGDAGDLARVAQKILEVASQPVEVAGRHVTLTASAGVSVYPGDADDGQELLRSAESAMYHAKEAGRNNFQFFAREMNRRTVEALEMETRLLRAVVGDELFLFFQPQLEVETMRLVGAEALVRWRDPERGVIPPSVFIPLAEERGLVAPIGEWVLRHACEEAVRWERAGLGRIPVAVNISALQFRQPAFPERLKRIVAETGIDPTLLELELTEGILMKEAENVIDLLRSLREAGFRFAIDDFGTGWSSLSYLRRFPIDRLKVDQSFVSDLGKDVGADSIVQAIISIARNLRLRVVAEGVETKRQLAFLRFHGCDEVQGFFLCKPCAPEAMWGRMKDGRLEIPEGEGP